MSDTLTKIHAYKAIFLFLDEIYERTKSDDIGTLLGAMSLLADGSTADNAIQAIWETAIEAAAKDPAIRLTILSTSETLTKEHVYKAMCLYLEHFRIAFKSDDIESLLGDMSLRADGSTADNTVQARWEAAIEAAANDPDINLKLSPI